MNKSFFPGFPADFQPLVCIGRWSAEIFSNLKGDGRKNFPGMQIYVSGEWSQVWETRFPLNLKPK